MSCKYVKNRMEMDTKTAFDLQNTYLQTNKIILHHTYFYLPWIPTQLCFNQPAREVDGVFRAEHMHLAHSGPVE